MTTTDETADRRLDDYRNSLERAEEKAQEDFDKTVVYLSTGALGVSFAFVHQYLEGQAPTAQYLLLLAWTAWALSAFAVLLSYYFSQQALRHAIEQVDRKTIDDEHAGGRFDKVTGFLNGAGAALFFVGLVMMIVFVGCNLEKP